MFNPDPKKKRIVLKGKAKTELKKALYIRAKGRCESCNKLVLLYIVDYAGNMVFDLHRCGHIHHEKTVGAGGDDSMENCKYECFDCHRAKHDGKDR